MSKVLQVVNWDKYQHYKHRNPPWIMLHRRILDDRAFMLLQPAAQCLLMLLWVLASEHEGAIPYDLENIAFRLRRKAISDAEIGALVKAGFITLSADAQADASKCLQSAAKCCSETDSDSDSDSETDTETEAYKSCAEPETDSTPADPPVMIFVTSGKPDTWGLGADLIEEWGALYPGVDVLSECRKALAWTNANPTRRKTCRGMEKFLVGWLGRAQDRGRR